MKILFFISVYSHGRGGHAHSLNHVSKELGKNLEIQIISIGPGHSQIIESNPHFLYHINFKGYDIKNLYYKIKKTIQNTHPDIIHFFDNDSYNILSLFLSPKKYKIILNKCGGPNSRYYPFVNNLILFSLENQEWFQSQKKYKKTNIHLIPNRVQPIVLDNEFSPVEKKTGIFNFVRICRITPAYKKSIEDSIRLVKKLNEETSTDVKLYVIGTIEDNSLFHELKTQVSEENESVIFLTDPIYTKEASKMLYLADAVIGTGRGFMEAASLKIPLLALNANDNYPVLVDEYNFNDIFKTNFSQRNNISNYNINENLASIIKLITNINYYNSIASFSCKIYNKYFNINNANKLYMNAYERCKLGNNKYFNNFPLILRSLYRFYSFHKKNKDNEKK